MGESKIIRRGGTASEAIAPTISIIPNTNQRVFTLTNNDNNTAIISYKIDTQTGAFELNSGQTSQQINITIDAGTYDLEAYATIVGKKATSQITSLTLTLSVFYELGDEKAFATGGWVPGYEHDSGSQSKENDHLFLRHTGGSLAVRTYITDNTINLTGFNTLKVDWSKEHEFGPATAYGFGATTDKNLQAYSLTRQGSQIITTGAAWSEEDTSDFVRQIQTTDISTLSGSYYLFVVAWSNGNTNRAGNVELYKMELE